MELVKLHLDDVHHERRILHVRLGKGCKDRYVPIGQRALDWLGRYLAEVRPMLVLKHAEQALFVTSYGGAFSADVLGRRVTKYIRDADMGRTGGTIYYATPVPVTSTRPESTSASSSSSSATSTSTPPPSTPRSASSNPRDPRPPSSRRTVKT